MARIKTEAPEGEYIEPSSIFLSEDWDIIDDDFYDLDMIDELHMDPWDDDES